MSHESFETRFLTFAEKYYTDSENITQNDKENVLRKLNTAGNDYGQWVSILFTNIYDHLNIDFQKIFALKQLKVSECKTVNNTIVSRNQSDKMLPMLGSFEYRREEKISKLVIDRLKGETTNIPPVEEGCHTFKRCEAMQKNNGERCKNPSLKAKNGVGFGPYCGKHIQADTKGEWTNITNKDKKIYSEDNVYQNQVSYRPIGENVIIEFDDPVDPNDFKLIIEHKLAINPKTNYNLVGLIFYISASSQYVAHIKRGKTWYCVDQKIKEITSDKVFRYKKNNDNPPCMLFYTKGITKAIRPVHLLLITEKKYSFFDCLMDTILGLQSVRDWVNKNGKKRDRQTRIRQKDNSLSVTRKQRSKGEKDSSDDDDDDDDGRRSRSNNNSRNFDNDGNDNGDGYDNDNGDGYDNNDGNGDGDGDGNGDGDGDGDGNGDGNEDGDGDGDNSNERDVEENDETTYPQIYEEDGTQRIVTADQRRGNTEYPMKYDHLLEKNSWLNKLRDQYDGMENLKNSGRMYNGSDIVLKNIEGERFKDPNQVFQSKYTLETSYIYIISKKIGDTVYYKVGEGGSKNKESGPGRLGDAQTFLPFGLRDEVGFRVHYLLFFNKMQHPNVPQFLSYFVEQKVHSNLRFNFRSASIAFASGNPSEWYVVPDKDLSIFLGFIFDVVSSYKILPVATWKLVPSDTAKITIKFDSDWATRLRVNPKNVERDEVRNVGSTIVIKHHYREDIGDVGLFTQHLTGDFVLPGGQEAVELAWRTFHVSDVIKNKKVPELGQPLEINTFYAIVTNRTRTFDEIKDHFANSNISIHEIKLDANADEKCKFYMSIDKLLEITKKNKYNTAAQFDQWPLKNIYNNYNKKTHHTETYKMPNNFVAPAWYFKSDIQLAWAVKITSEEEYVYHYDYEKEFGSGVKHYWKSTKFYTEKFHNSDTIVIVRERAKADTNEIIPDKSEIVPVLRVMYVLSVHEIKPTGKKKTGKEKEVTLPNCKIHKKTIQNGCMIEVDDDYFTYYDETTGVAEETANYKGKKTAYIVKKVYDKVHHDKTLNPWIDIQKYPSSKDKRIWCILVPDLETPLVKAKVRILAETPEKIKDVKKKLDKEEEASEDILRKESEERTLSEPKFKPKTIIRLKPAEYHPHVFGEDETEKTEYHYATVVKLQSFAKTKKDVQYEIRYFPPWDKNEPWGYTPKANAYIEKHLISNIDKYAEKVDKKDEHLLTYIDNLTGKYEIEIIYDHYPRYNDIKSHTHFMETALNENETEPKYMVKWRGYEKGVDNENDATMLFEDAPLVINEYWKRKQPLPKRVTRGDTKKAAPVVGGGKKRTTKKKKRRRKKNEKN